MSVALLSQAKKLSVALLSQAHVMLVIIAWMSCTVVVLIFQSYQKFRIVTLLSQAKKSKCGTTQQAQNT